MNKSGLIEELARRENLTEKKATDVVNLIFKGFTEELKISGRIEIRGFGSFVVRDYESYTGRNPKTGMNITVSPEAAPLLQGRQRASRQGEPGRRRRVNSIS